MSASKLRALLANKEQILRTPCCHDALSARLIQQSGKFNAAFLSGFGVAATKALPDVGLVSFEDSMQQCRSILDAVSHGNELFPTNNSFPVIVDADTGYGNEVNVRRTIATLGRMGAAGIMLEDQENPKRCGHTRGKRVVPLEQAMQRVKAACDVRRELGLDLMIIARTDSRTEHGIEHAIERAKRFYELGADATFIEAPTSLQELELIGKQENCGFKMCNMLLHGKTPAVGSRELKEMGFNLAAYPFDLLVASIAGMNRAIQQLDEETSRDFSKKDVDAMWDVVGFNKYYDMEQRYK